MKVKYTKYGGSLFTYKYCYLIIRRMAPLVACPSCGGHEIVGTSFYDLICVDCGLIIKNEN